MESRALGDTGLAIPRVALGTVKLGRNRDVKYPEGFDLPTDAEVARLLEGAWEMGVRCLDTAPAYGHSEARLAGFVAAHRDQVVICTKAGEDYDEAGSHHDFSPAAIEASVERSLQRLGCDRLDLVLLHSHGGDLTILNQSGALDALRGAQKRGQIGAVGISAKTAEGIAAAAPLVDVIMAPYSRQDPALGPALRAAAGRGCGIMAIKTLGSGHLARGGEAAAQAALEHVMAQEWIDIVVIGTLRLTHLRQAVDVASANSST